MTPRIETLFLSLSTFEHSLLNSFSTQTLNTDSCLFQMADNGWSGGICPAGPGLPKLLLLSLECIGVVDPPEYIYREYDSRGTLRCDMMIFVGKSTRYPDVEPWFISTTGFCFPDTYRNAARKALRRLRVVYKRHLQQTPMGFFPPTGGRGRS